VIRQPFELRDAMRRLAQDLIENAERTE
jgi:hypothetical protein